MEEMGKTAWVGVVSGSNSKEHASTFRFAERISIY